MPDTNGRAGRSRTEWVGLAGIGAMLATHLVWDTTLTLLGVAAFGIEEEGTAIVRELLWIHPVAWILAKVVVMTATTWVMLRLDAHRSPATAWVPWLLAVLGFVGPLGWFELLL
ncbi:MAG: hypothetical protein ABEH58_00955 [Haloplanus sp.]